MKNYVIVSLILFLIGICCFAQSNEVKLVVSSDGPTKEEAIKNALRSAIEQAFGTFVSANTEILNDELVKDEIVSVSSGNIRSYNELSSEMSNGIYSVTLETIVSIGRLVSFAQNHGSSAEFAGQTFAMNMRMRELNKKNEAQALDHLLVTLESYNALFDYSITLDEAKALSSDQWNPKPGYPYFEYRMQVEINTSANKNFRLFVALLERTLSALSLTVEERAEYERNETPYTWLALPVFGGFVDNTTSSDFPHFTVTKCFCLRNDSSIIREFCEKVLSVLSEEMSSFSIVQHNTEGKVEYRLTTYEGYDRSREPFDNMFYRRSIPFKKSEGNGRPLLSSNTLCFPEFSYSTHSPYRLLSDKKFFCPASVDVGMDPGFMGLRIGYYLEECNPKYRSQSAVFVTSLDNHNRTPFENNTKTYELFFTSDQISSIIGFEIVPDNISQHNGSDGYRNVRDDNVEADKAFTMKTMDAISFDVVAKKPSARGYKTDTMLTLLRDGTAFYCYGTDSESIHVDFVVDESGKVSDITYGTGVPDRAKDSIRQLIQWPKWSPGIDAAGNPVPVRIDIDTSKSAMSSKKMMEYSKFAHNAKLPDHF